jgi:hypothetical protein
MYLARAEDVLKSGVSRIGVCRVKFELKYPKIAKTLHPFWIP